MNCSSSWYGVVSLSSKTGFWQRGAWLPCPYHYKPQCATEEIWWRGRGDWNVPTVHASQMILILKQTCILRVVQNAVLVMLCQLLTFILYWICPQHLDHYLVLSIHEEVTWWFQCMRRSQCFQAMRRSHDVMWHCLMCGCAGWVGWLCGSVWGCMCVWGWVGVHPHVCVGDTPHVCVDPYVLGVWVGTLACVDVCGCELHSTFVCVTECMHTEGGMVREFPCTAFAYITFAWTLPN